VRCALVLVQVSGSAIASSGNWKGSTVTIGTDVLIAGLATQVATFAFFMAIIVRFHVLTRRERDVKAGEKWRKMLFAIYVSSILIIVGELPHHWQVQDDSD
jgi:RTA1 like protein